MLITTLMTAVVSAGDTITTNQMSVPVIPAGDLITDTNLTAGSLLDFLTMVDSIAEHAIHIVVYLIALGSFLSVISPPALTKDDPNNTKFGRLRKTKLYSIYRKIISLCGANVGWAKNLANPKSLAIIHKAIIGIASADALSSLANDAKASVDAGHVTTDDVDAPEEEQPKT